MRRQRVLQSVVGLMDPKETPPPTRVETRDERKERKRKERQEQHAYKLEQDLALWDPATNGSSTMDPFKTLFIARIDHRTRNSRQGSKYTTISAAISTNTTTPTLTTFTTTITPTLTTSTTPGFFQGLESRARSLSDSSLFFGKKTKRKKKGCCRTTSPIAIPVPYPVREAPAAGLTVSSFQ
ncbi:hypothetical protein PoB_001382200 [Plakobranchus ocellatus]|uniref:U1 small nuclear ribonucleoprotein of 70kDa N-terminal domain-containing protein n=1 Tax=Plakobranchus ocellatus TaxID=259542 RepID=A0AAV3YWF8_9GAST|nr:hypothetical protein PoB_001382200 [Plakobranchus ocellatus]